MIRAHHVHSICTNKPTFDKETFDAKHKALKDKVGDEFSETKLKEYSETRGIITLAKDFQKELEKKRLFLTDPLPEGAKTYLKELWLEENYGFVDTSLGGDALPLLKGNLVEDDAIKLIAKGIGVPLEKNTETVIKGFLAGTCDVKYIQLVKRIRDNKSPITWKTFKSKNRIETPYYWQGIGYCYLYDAKVMHVDYTLMPDPEPVVDAMIKKLSESQVEKYMLMQEKIKSMSVSERWKTYEIDEETVAREIKFLKARLEKSEKYYKSLTYNECMGILT